MTQSTRPPVGELRSPLTGVLGVPCGGAVWRPRLRKRLVKLCCRGGAPTRLRVAVCVVVHQSCTRLRKMLACAKRQSPAPWLPCGLSRPRRATVSGSDVRNCAGAGIASLLVGMVVRRAPMSREDHLATPSMVEWHKTESRASGFWHAQVGPVRLALRQVQPHTKRAAHGGWLRLAPLFSR